ncbi:MAG: 50S ribosomal protein L25 [Candidatus Kapabacteria bacterium]|nr:50S ribosomal protein L25 [Candidatus Kapabacteria bacterium]
MSEVLLNAQKRGTGKKTAKDIRRAGNVPGIFYVNGTTPIAISTRSLDMRPIVYTKDAKIIKLNIEGQGEAYNCVLKDITFDPITDKMTHFDLHGFAADALVEFEVPVRITGQSIGVRDGGKLEHVLHKVTVKCLPANLPEHIDVDVTTLKINSSIHVKDLSVSNVAFITKGELTVVSVTPPRLSDDTAAAGATEPELVGQKGKKDDK